MTREQYARYYKLMGAPFILLNDEEVEELKQLAKLREKTFTKHSEDK